ncbi:MAG: ABC transporter ATP-binding protein [Clostridiaceae bacterium]
MQIKLEHLVKKFGDATAVQDLSLTIESGKLLTLLGPSGCGKSTVLNMISGILPASSGRIWFDDKDVTSLPPEKRNVGLVFQNYALYPHMTALENICFPLEIKRVPKKQRIERARELAELIRISDLLDRKPLQMSGGQQQRVAIARALAKEPQVFLMDEPLSNLDAKLRVEMREEILRIQRASKVTTVFVTHDQEEALSISDSVVVLKNGVFQQQATARTLYDEPENYFVADFLGTPPINKLFGVMKNGCFCFKDSELHCELPLRHPVEDGEEAVLAVRPESILLSAARQKLPCIVDERYSVGKDELAILNIAGQTMRGFVNPEYPISTGDKLECGFKQRGVFLFDKNTGERLS